MNCIFCKIIQGEIPCQKLYENERVLAFLDINPLSKGHFLIIPKTHAEKLHEIPDAELQDILIVAKNVINALNPEEYNLLQNNGPLAHQEVKHAHFHIIPKTKTQGLGIIWKSISITKEELSEIAKKVSSKLN